MPAASSAESDRLATIEELSRELDEWRQALIEAIGELGGTTAGRPDESYQQRLKDTAARLVQMDDELHGADFDPEWLAEFRGLLLDSLRAMQNDRPLDGFDELLLAIEAMRHLLRDALDGHVERGEDDIAAVVEQLHQWLPRVSQPELAELMGISIRQYQRWGHMHSPPTRRAQIVARMIAILRRSWTDAGVVAWFYRPRHELDGQAPLDVLDDAAWEPALFRAVRQGRAQHGA